MVGCSRAITVVVLQSSEVDRHTRGLGRGLAGLRSGSGPPSSPT